MGNRGSKYNTFEYRVDRKISKMKGHLAVVEGPNYYITATAEECAICKIGDTVYLFYMENGNLITKWFFFSTSAYSLQTAFKEVVSRKKTPKDAWATAKYMI